MLFHLLTSLHAHGDKIIPDYNSGRGIVLKLHLQLVSNNLFAKNIYSYAQVFCQA